MRTFFVSDTHFGHINILKYVPERAHLLAQYLHKHECPSDTIEHIENRVIEVINGDDDEAKRQLIIAHDNMLIEKWNAVVRKDDIVWHLGDFCLSSKEYATSIVQRLHGHKKLILGNHDRFKPAELMEMGFEYVSRYPILLKHSVMLSHAPLAIAANNGGFTYFYGHVHQKPCFLDNTSYCYCVCLERNGFVPVRIAAYDNAQ